MLSVLRFYHQFSGSEIEFWEEGACVMWEHLDARTAVFLWLRSQLQSQHLLSIWVSSDHRREPDDMMIANLIADFVCTESSVILRFGCILHMVCRVERVKYILFFKPHCSLQESKQSKTFQRLAKGVFVWFFFVSVYLKPVIFICTSFGFFRWSQLSGWSHHQRGSALK